MSLPPSASALSRKKIECVISTDRREWRDLLMAGTMLQEIYSVSRLFATLISRLRLVSLVSPLRALRSLRSR